MWKLNSLKYFPSERTIMKTSSCLVNEKIVNGNWNCYGVV